MPRKNLTDAFVASLKSATRADYWDEKVRGLVLRVSPSGVKTWTIVYTRQSDSTKQRITLGRYPAIGLEKARSKALKIMGAVSEGDDPSEEKRARRASMTVTELGELFIEKYAKPNKRTWKDDERLLKVEVYPEIGKMKAVAVKKGDIIGIVDAKADAGFGAQSTNILAVMRKMFGWAVDRDYLPASPVTGVKPRAKPVRRDRVLSDAEIKAIWTMLIQPKNGLSVNMIAVIKLLLLTGQRSGEVAGMMRSEIDLEDNRWIIPGSRTKNGLEHVVPLAPRALTIIKLAIDATDPDDDDAPLFSRVGQPMASNAVAQAVRLKLQKASNRRFTAHDFRRTVATKMADIGTAPHIVEAVLNHISGFRSGVAGTYNRAHYELEKAEALETWETYLSEIVPRASVG